MTKGTGKVNAGEKLVKMEELMGKEADMLLNDAEKINLSILLEKAQEIQAQFERVQTAIQGLVRQVVTLRGLDPAKYGMNLAAGRILPLEAVDSRKDGNEEIK